MLRALSFSLLFPLAACAGSSGSPDQRAEAGDCFNVGQVSGFSEQPGSAVRVHTSVNRSYDLELTGPSCDDVGWARSIALDAAPSRWMCVGDQPVQGRVRFRDSGSQSVTSCQVTRVTRSEPAETAGRQ